LARHRDGLGKYLPWWVGLLLGVLLGGVGVFVVITTVRGETTATGQSVVPTPDPLQDCPSTTTVRAVAPGLLVPMLDEAAAAACLEVDLTQADGREGVRAGEDTDLWLTDSSLWVAARHADPGPGVSIASSPIVASVDPALADELGGTLDWATLLDPQRTVRIGLHDPSATATGLLGAWPILKAQRDVSDVPFTALALTAGALAQPAAVGTEVLSAPPSRMVVLSGEYVADPSSSVGVVRGSPAEPYMDFPAYNVATDPGARQAVSALIRVLASSEMADARAQASLREADGTANFDTSRLGQAPRRMKQPNEGSTIKLYGLGASGSVRGRLLVALDVSRSMGAIQPDGKPLLDSVLSTALIAMNALYDHTSVGVWLFGTDVGGTTGHEELVPIAPLGENRKQIAAAVEKVKVSPTSTSTLYPTILDGYRYLQQGFDPGAAQSLVIFTDGQGARGSGLSLDELVTQLKAAEVPDQHIRVMGVGFGADARVRGLNRLSSEMGGASARVQGPVAMLGVFITMVGQVAAQG
jgi:hypothetical protein